MEYLTLRKDLRNIELEGLYFGGHYTWRLLLQNDPHDSICGCSVDAVHEEMMTRYQKAQEVGGRRP